MGGVVVSAIGPHGRVGLADCGDEVSSRTGPLGGAYDVVDAAVLVRHGAGSDAGSFGVTQGFWLARSPLTTRSGHSSGQRWYRETCRARGSADDYDRVMIRPGEIVVGVDQVRSLLAEQFPQWAGLPIAPQPLSGTDNALFRVGDDLVARLPRAPWAVGQVETDATWLPLLAPHLPVPVPVPIAVGRPGPGYPWSWTVVPWLPGRNPSAGMDLVGLAIDLAAFVRAMIATEPLNGPVKQGIERGVPLERRDELTRRSIKILGNRIDGPAVTAAWDEAVGVDRWPGPPVWLHGDLMKGNLLVAGARLSAVIDFGPLGRGDPAIELLPCWDLFGSRARAAYVEALGFDEATWTRGWAWWLSIILYWLADLWDALSDEDRADGLRRIGTILRHRHG